MNITAALNSAREELAESGIANPRREAASLLVFSLKRSSTFLITHPEYELTAPENILFNEVVKRRSNREPFQYIVGHQEFYGLDFEVSPDVLIPRPETEILVEDAIETLQQLSDPHFCEIGVGSGCISVSILDKIKNATAVGIDLSDNALAIARHNAVKHHVADRIKFIEGDIFGSLTDKFDVIVSNPPYIPDGDVPALQPEVIGYEPESALAGGSDGLDIVGRIIIDSPELLSPGGVLLIEIGFGQSEAVAKLLDPSAWNSPVFLPDLQSVPRVLRVSVRS